LRINDTKVPYPDIIIHLYVLPLFLHRKKVISSKQQLKDRKKSLTGFFAKALFPEWPLVL